jgi:ATP-binding cassette, subfamily B, bacterial MsbA
VTLFRFLLRYRRRHAVWVLLAVLSAPVYAVASAAVVALIEPVFQDVLLSSPAPHASGTPDVAPAVRSVPRLVDLKGLADRGYAAAKRWAGVDARNVVLFTPALLVLFFGARVLADSTGSYAFQRVGLGITTAIGNDLERRLVEQSARFHARHPSGELLSRAINDVARVQTILSSRVFDLLQQSGTLVLLVALLVSTDPQLGLVVLLGAPLFGLFLFRFGKRARHLSRTSQARMAEVAARLSEGIRGHLIIQAHGVEETEHRRFAAANARYLASALKVQRHQALSPLVTEMTAVLGTAGFLVYAGFGVRSGRLSGALLVQFIANVLLLYDPLRKLNSANLALQQAMAIGHRVLELFHEPNDIVEAKGAVALPAFTERIVFDDITVRIGERTVLDHLSLEVHRGETVAFVGPSGSGKTTLVSLLPRLLDPDAGRVTLDGHDIRGLTLASLRGLVSFVPQRTFLFDDSIRANIALGRPDVPFERVEAVARAASAHAFIAARPEGYDAVVGEGGRLLSGGERQRIALARALLRDAPILVLDEATSELDSESEAAVAGALRTAMAGRTVLVVAHRLTTAQQADRIVVVESGRIVETGNHDELLAHSGTYRRLFEHWSSCAKD